MKAKNLSVILNPLTFCMYIFSAAFLHIYLVQKLLENAKLITIFMRNNLQFEVANKYDWSTLTIK